MAESGTRKSTLGEIGMDRSKLKKLLIRSTREPVNCALAQGSSKSGGLGLIVLHKIKPPKTLMVSLKKQFPFAKNFCFGTVSVGSKINPKLVIFILNKRLFGLRKEILRTLRQVGFREAEFEKQSL